MIQVTMDSRLRLVMFGMTSRLVFSTEQRSCLDMSGKLESLRDSASTNSMVLMLGVCPNGNTDIKVANQHHYDLIEDTIVILHF